MTLVDVGAGAGRLGRQLALSRPEVHYRFIEPIESLAANLTQEYGATAVADIDNLGDADIVTLLDVLEHQDDDVSFLRALTATMRPNAQLVITVPALPHLWSAWDVELGHYRRYTKRSLVRCLHDAGLVVDEAAYLFPELWPAGLARRVRHPARRAAAAPAAEFRPVPAPVNSLLIGVGTMGVRLRRWLPFGTSVFAVAHRRDDQR